VARDPSQDGGIQGTVKNQTGGSVPNATVTLKSESLLISPRSVITSADGNYQIRSLLPGAYAVCVEAGGYQASQRNGVVVNADAVTIADFSLTPASPSPTQAESNTSACQSGFNADLGMQAAEFTGSVDPGGYSASAGTQTKSNLLEDATDLSNQSNRTTPNEGAPPPSDLNLTSTFRETQLRRVQEADPDGFRPNHELGRFYFDAGKLATALPFLERAHRASPANYDNDYVLARAYWQSRRLQEARSLIAETMVLQDTAELHNLLAQIEVSQGYYRVALKEYERAFQMKPTEANRYDWGLELLLQGDIAPALALFKEGATREPQSAKLWIGLGIALYSAGHSEEAVSAFLRATDLNPTDPRPYMFLGEAYGISNKETRAVSTRLNRWVQLEPRNAKAYYYYALSLMKGNRDASHQDMGRAESLFKESTSLDPTFPFGHLQLGNLYSTGNRFLEAIAEYQEAVRLKPDLAEAHYRLGQVFIRTGQRELGQQQLALYEQLHGKQPLQEQRVQGQQFVESIKARESTKPAPP
jgi:tetratricopeptide (TPR) repeat protein